MWGKALSIPLISSRHPSIPQEMLKKQKVTHGNIYGLDLDVHDLLKSIETFSAGTISVEGVTPFFVRSTFFLLAFSAPTTGAINLVFLLCFFCLSVIFLNFCRFLSRKHGVCNGTLFTHVRICPVSNPPFSTLRVRRRNIFDKNKRHSTSPDASGLTLS